MSWRKANKTVEEVQQWGRDSKAYKTEQQVKRGEVPAPKNTETTKDKK